ncbi:MAG: polyprenyl synthetase family protein [Bacteroidales bacterium]|nr:polyprenyl synthetase family protein [Bacteroidales bacterium]
MKTFEDLRHLVEDEFNNLDLPKQPNNLYAPIKYALTQGGKRMRPVLTLMACNIFSDNIEPAIKPALGLEIFHNFTLLHDDIMDCSDLRRGHPTVHSKWNNNIAILAGDAMAFVAMQYVAAAPQNVAQQVSEIFNRTALEVCEGQQFDMDFETSNNVHEKDYINMIRLKTAVLPAACLKIGALIGGANEEQAQHLYNLGINIGLAFQLQDDYLDVFSTPDVLGKPIGGDIVENKKTFLLIKTLGKLDVIQRNDLLKYLADKTVERYEKVSYVTDIYTRMKVADDCRKKIEKYFAAAYNELSAIDVDNSRLEMLRAFMDKIANRKK